MNVRQTRLHWALGSWGCSGLFARHGLAMNPGKMAPVLAFPVSMTDTRVGHVFTYKDE